MRQIVKGPEPQSLTEHRLRSFGDYENYAKKDDLRRALVAEQRGLCCYCMGRIRPEPESMRIEHWRCQADHPNERLNYRNLLGACLGGDGQKECSQHCDTRKGNRDLQWNPADAAHPVETRVRYESDGSIHSGERAFDAQLDEVLNLNLPRLKQNRKSVLAAVLEWWKFEKERCRGPVPRDRVVAKRDKLIAGDGELKPYSPVAVWWLEQKIRRK